MAAHNDLGCWGEELATTFLQDHGYIILERDWHYGKSKSDIDIICKSADRRLLVFVEVKTRTNEDLTCAQDAVTTKKMRFIGKAAHDYVLMHDIVEDIRFDIITVVGTPQQPNTEINHIEDAFNPLLI